jgi:glyoxalase/bleomycin resistance protein/dioxygenase superfamily protein
VTAGDCSRGVLAVAFVQTSVRLTGDSGPRLQILSSVVPGIFRERKTPLAPRSPEFSIDWTFVLDGAEYTATLKRGTIVHQAFHAALPIEAITGRRLVFRTEHGDEVYPDNFLGDIADHLGVRRLLTTSTPIPASDGAWRNIGFDHLALTVADRPGARDFLTEVIQMQCIRDDPHLTCLTTGPTTLMLFDAGQDAPLTTGFPSSWHHLGFVVDDLAAAYAHLRRHADRISSDFAMLERDERWSLYFFYKNGDVTLMFQFSEVKEAERGITDPARADFAQFLYDYAKRPYGIDWELHAAGSGIPAPQGASS